jgi:hypothetical protein
MSGASQGLRALVLAVGLSSALSACANIQELNEELFSDRGIFGSTPDGEETEAVTAEAPAQQAAQPETQVNSARVLNPPLPRRKPGKPGPESLQTAALGEDDFDALQYAAADPLRQKDLSENPDPERLVGMGFSDAIAVLGVPMGQREEPPARVWSYRSESCAFNLFFFPGLEESTYRVLTYEVIDYRLKSESDPEREGLRVARAHLSEEGQEIGSGFEMQSGDGLGETGQSQASAEEGAEGRIEDSQIIRRCLAEVLAKENPEQSG